ncbi:hypothetical protein CGLO_13453 [Colletotrichum gloeosporioides Cg-14]|uniref:Uncharacterized protein n=1 Tax=Colletotrichum gloeosporioides (strain Cg-14) TaxID=1237896 RepID=T0L749_COLGC|nr:hypothetical protein CGLO_13453 [Colletotrichum gloeosporioides Cg-14]
MASLQALRGVAVQPDHPSPAANIAPLFQQPSHTSRPPARTAPHRGLAWADRVRTGNAVFLARFSSSGCRQGSRDGEVCIAVASNTGHRASRTSVPYKSAEKKPNSLTDPSSSYPRHIYAHDHPIFVANAQQCISTPSLASRAHVTVYYRRRSTRPLMLALMLMLTYYARQP